MSRKGYEEIETPSEYRSRWERGFLISIFAAVIWIGSGTQASSKFTSSLVFDHRSRTAHRESDSISTEDDTITNNDDLSLDTSSVTVNVTKMTWAVTDVVSARQWFHRYLATSKAADGCNPYCSCGDQGRVELNGTVLGCQSMFGLHTVDSFSKPSGPLSLEYIEGVFDTKLGDMDSYVDVMDFHLGLFVINLDPWIELFESDGIPVHAIKWTSADKKSMVSIIVQVIGTVILEICSEHQSYFDLSSLELHPLRFAGEIGVLKQGISQDLVPIWASRASSNVTRDYLFWRDILGAKIVWEDTTTGSTMRYLEINTDPTVFEIHFIQRPADYSGGMSIANLEDYYGIVHSATVHGPYCGWDVWFDNHIGVDYCNGEPCPELTEDHRQRAVAMDNVVNAVERYGAKYRLWKQMQMNETGRWIYNLYIVEPSGQALQLNGFVEHASSSHIPKWNMSLCGQGNCTN